MEFKLPEIGEGIQEGELIKWLVKEGDAVKPDQALLEVMTDKATVEVPSTVGGVVKNIAAKEGQMIKVGQTLATIEEGGATKAPQATSPSTTPATATSGNSSAPKAAPEAAKAAPEAPKAPAQNWFASAPAPAAAKPSTNGNGHGTGATAAATPSYGAAPRYSGALESLEPSAVPAAPIVRAMAQRMGVDLQQVPASGPEVGDRKRVLEEDLLKYLNQQQGGTTPAAPTRKVSGSLEVERKPLRGLRRVIAQAMVKSKFTAPHYAYVDRFECSELIALREEAKKFAEQSGVKLSYLPFIVKALVGALKEFPILNSSLEEGPNGSEVVYKKYYHIGIAVASPDGLVVPVIKHADQKSLLEIAQDITQLSEKVRQGKATSDELKGSTFSITSMGNIGGLFGTPIINYPEVGILGVYKVQDEAVVKNGAVVPGKMMYLALSADHRVVDGAVAGAFINSVMQRLANPARLMLEMV